MPKLLRQIIAVVIGIIIGSCVNMALVTFSPALIPPPAGVDVTNAESLKQSIHLFQPQHFIMPFLAHALGTFSGALVAYLLAVSHHKQLAFGIGAFYFCGGLAASFMIPAPAWFITLDLLLAYLPMAWLAVWLGFRLRPATTISRG
ncbi:hypothetical protein A5320_20150 [Rheinheimera sp. SA_1]|uniref:hypothetical protein n=1 Tax=Rheinheimera sp. SA_1 TaxID=1827365 RepID=UPI0007FEFA47|nr:hypothetical protein [Rheinheimera sp. SA_1]OBP13155.1 hypothetical protein A5320_20150 [Rheinheimera sp. SA_1]